MPRAKSAVSTAPTPKPIPEPENGGSQTDIFYPSVDIRQGFQFRYLFYLFVPLLIFLSLISHNPDDLNVVFGASDPVTICHNWAGPAGAYIAAFFYLWFGIAAWPIFLLILLAFIRPFFPPRVHRRGYFGALIAALFGITILFAVKPTLFINDFLIFQGTNSLGIGHLLSGDRALSGGLIGQFFAAPPIPSEGIHGGILHNLIGSVGTTCVGIISCVLGLFFVFRADWMPVIKLCFQEVPQEPKKTTDEADESVFVYKTEATPDSAFAPVVDVEQPELPIPPPPPAVAARPRPAREPERTAPDPDLDVTDKPLFPVRDRAEVPPPSDEDPTADRPLFSRRNVSAPLPESALTHNSNAPELQTAIETRQDIRSITPPPVVQPAAAPIPPAPSASPVSNAQFTVKVNQEGMERAIDITPTGKELKTQGQDVAPYILPSVPMLTHVEAQQQGISQPIHDARVQLEETLNSFNVSGQVSNIIIGPKVIRFEVLLAPGTKVNAVSNIQQNLAMNLKAENIRILAPIPGKNAVGVEIPNPTPQAVHLRQVMESDVWRNNKMEIPLVLGKDVNGKPVIADLANMPHALIAGATKAGKSVCMNSLLMSLLFKFSPDDLKLILVDPKIVEMENYKDLPHLITPVINHADKVPLALRWAAIEMDHRYEVMAACKCKNLAGFNNRANYDPEAKDSFGKIIPHKMPYIVIVIDELADMMLTESKNEVEQGIARIAQKGRAAGIHILVATQRPDSKIVTGLIKANLPTRIAFKVASQVDSRVILDQSGAERLLGQGDMLFIMPGIMTPERIQGSWANDDDIQKVVNFVCSQRSQQFLEGILVAPEDEEDEKEESYNPRALRNKKNARRDDDSGDGDYDEIMDEPETGPVWEKYVYPGDTPDVRKALEILFRDRKISTSYIQRCLGIGYNKAAEIMDVFEKRGIIGPQKDGGSKRDILIFDELNQRDS